ncbi:MAG: bifunctional N-acetylglucosamine-1-phosphate uridyltransferase/glucosamine-1-phosphate acetyltransferase [Deltaproteobacteria bacterium]|nr:bifunctional N-acetylglucosamine-1-phosphate uridyltransferase/glucosamine-1-phosphate acetyltransferase [Deltaproteobacteria bacterium]
MSIAAVILAAGKGTRFKSARAKVLHPLLGRPMVKYPLDVVRRFKVEPLVVIVGHQAEAVKAACRAEGVKFVLQAEQKGTGHAVACAARALAGFSGDVLILPADAPLIKAETIEALIAAHRRSGTTTVSFTWAKQDDPTGYGRIVRGAIGFTIVEDKDADPSEKLIKEVNVGLYLVKADYLFEALKDVKSDNAQGEYYLPDIVNLARTKGARCRAFEARDPEEVLGVNDRAQLAQAERRLRRDLVKSLMQSGVTCQDPAAVYIDWGVKIGEDTELGAGGHLLGRTAVGQGVVIEPGCYLRDVVVGDGARIRFGCRLEGVRVEPNQTVETAQK